MDKEELFKWAKEFIERLLDNGKKYLVESASSGTAYGGMTCSGWHPGPKIAEIKVKPEAGESFFLSVSDADGCPYYFKTEESTFDFQIEEPKDDDAWDELEAHTAACGMSFQEVFEMNMDSDLLPLFFILESLSKEEIGKNIRIDKRADEVIKKTNFHSLTQV